MTLPQIAGICALLVALIGFASKISVEAEVIDLLALVGTCVALGYLWGAS